MNRLVAKNNYRVKGLVMIDRQLSGSLRRNLERNEMSENCKHKVQTYKVTHPNEHFGAKISFGKCFDCGETVSKVLVVNDCGRFIFTHSNYLPGDEWAMTNENVKCTDFIGPVVVPMRKEEIEGK